MVLGAVGDALGFRKGRWENCISGQKIQEELATLGGLGALKLDPDNWPLSDATLMHMTTAEALVTGMLGGRDGLTLMYAQKKRSKTSFYQND